VSVTTSSRLGLKGSAMSKMMPFPEHAPAASFSAGKTVMFKIALGLLKPTSGRIYLFGQDVTDFKEAQWFEVRSHIGVLLRGGQQIRFQAQ
jgi:energy-coupling factor transporter ATP-binding protein EcfA2